MIKKLYKSKTLGQTTLVTSGTILNALIGSLFFVTAARLLGPEQWGMLSILTTILVLLSDIFDFGTNSGIVRFVSGALARNDSVQALQAVKFSFKLKLASGIFLSLVGILTASWLAKLLFADERLGYLIFFTLLTTLPSLLYDFVSFTLQAQQKFWQYLAVALSSNLTRLILFIPLFLWLPGVFSALS
ncbi:oligosaccharide flippase family protein, partial [Candidatus Gottesmanbacteria bacterium]|nr:oligosaccharide flippase family protein [Candidatus Gottesmanbacteria bacterium]